MRGDFQMGLIVIGWNMKNRIFCLALVWLLTSTVGFGQNSRITKVMPIEFKPSDLVLLLGRDRANSENRPGLNFELKTPLVIEEAISLTVDTGGDPRIAALVDQFVRDLDDVINNRAPQARSNPLIPTPVGQGNDGTGAFGTPSQFGGQPQNGSGGIGPGPTQSPRQPDASQNWGCNDPRASAFSGAGQTQNPNSPLFPDTSRRMELNTPQQPTGMPLRDGVNPSSQPTSVIDQRGFQGQQPSLQDQNWLHQQQHQQQLQHQQQQQQPQSQPGFVPINTSGQQMVQAPLLRQPDPMITYPANISPYANQIPPSQWNPMYAGYPQTPATIPHQAGMYTSTWQPQPTQNNSVLTPEAFERMVDAVVEQKMNAQKNSRPGVAEGEPTTGGPLTAEIPGQKPSLLAQQESLAENARRQILFLFFLLLFSVALNVYLGVMARGFYSRYQDLADELRETFTTTA